MARSVVRATLVPALCLATALVQTAPLGLHLTTCIPFGNYPAPTVPRLNLWTLWWNADRLLHGDRGYWHERHDGLPDRRSAGRRVTIEALDRYTVSSAAPSTPAESPSRLRTIGVRSSSLKT